MTRFPGPPARILRRRVRRLAFEHLDDRRMLSAESLHPAPSASEAQAVLSSTTVDDSQQATRHAMVGRRADGQWWVTRSQGTDIVHAAWGGWSTAAEWEDVHVADVDGDQRDDIVGRFNGQWWVAKNTGQDLQNEYWGHWSTTVPWRDVRIADVDGNGRADIVGRANGQWWVARSQGDSFVNEPWGHWSNAVPWVDVLVADVDGNGLDDVVGRANGQWWVARSQGDSFVNELWGRWSNAVLWVDVLVADVDGNGQDDIVGRANGQWWVARSQGSTFLNEFWSRWSNSVSWRDVAVGDFDKDGQDDIAGRANGQWWVARSQGNKFANSSFGNWSTSDTWNDVRVGDFNGDGRDDVIGRTQGQWWISTSTGNRFSLESWGPPTTEQHWNDVATLGLDWSTPREPTTPTTPTAPTAPTAPSAPEVIGTSIKELSTTSVEITLTLDKAGTATLQFPDAILVSGPSSSQAALSHRFVFAAIRQGNHTISATLRDDLGGTGTQTLSLTNTGTVTGGFQYVSPSGSDTANGSFSAPYRSLRYALTKLQPGDGLYVRGGTYAESLTYEIQGGTGWHNAVALEAFPTEIATLAPPPGSNFGMLFATSKAAYFVVDGLHIDCSSCHYDGIKITYSTSGGAAHHIRIKNTEIKNAPNQGIAVSEGSNGNEFIGLDVHHNGTDDFDHGIYISSNDNIVEASRFHDNAGWGIHVYNGAGVTSHNIIRYNMSYDNAAVQNRGAGIGLYSGPNHEAYGNVVWGNDKGMDIGFGADNAKVHNNLFYSNRRAPITIDGTLTGLEFYNNTFVDLPGPPPPELWPAPFR